MVKRWYSAAAAGMLVVVASTALSTEQQAVTILYPRDKSVVGNKVNVVVDPATDWSSVPFFQVVVNKKEYPPVDTSSGRHAHQGLSLEQGVNSISVRLLAPSADKKKNAFTLLAVREIAVFNRDGNFAARPSGFIQEPFHTKEHEADCSGCHRLEVSPADLTHSKPEEVLCFACHREIPTGKHIHGPAAVWDCLSCHDPQGSPAKYQFNSIDPWKVAVTAQAAGLKAFTVSTVEMFNPSSVALLSPDKAKELLKDVLVYLNHNRGDRILLEVHTDSAPPEKNRKNGKGLKNSQALTEARAKALLALFQESGLSATQYTSTGAGDKLPKASNATQEGRDANNRVEIVVFPPDVAITSSQRLPVVEDRKRLSVDLAYTAGPPIKKLRIIEKLSEGFHYAAGSSFVNGRSQEPRIAGADLVWELGDRGANFSESLSFMLTKDAKASATAASAPVRLVYATADNRDVAREFDPAVPSSQGSTVLDVCMRCHPEILGGKFKHGPADAGYCNLCHDPHASPFPAWLRKESWDLCTTCHTEMAKGSHVVAGAVSGGSHPTRNRRDPARPGKRLACSSCHEPHSAVSPFLFTYKCKSRMELCGVCHGKK